MAGRYVSDTAVFEAVADALVRVEAPDRTKHDILAATMDEVGVPMLSLERYKDDPVIVALFAERGVRIAAGTDERLVGFTGTRVDPAVLLDDARTLAIALFSRLRDFIDGDSGFGEGLSWATLPDWLTGDGVGRELWAHGAEGTNG